MNARSPRRKARQHAVSRRALLKAAGGAGGASMLAPGAQAAGIFGLEFPASSSITRLLGSTSAQAAAASSALEVYVSATSVKAGSVIRFYGRDPLGSTLLDKTFSLTITRMGSPDVNVLTTSIKLRKRTVPSTAYSTGCGWPANLSLAVPSTWKSGLYWATVGTGSATTTVPFVVRPASPTPGTRVLVQVPVTTMQAYNNYGGKSLYEYNSSGGVRASKVSFDRPHTDPWNYAFDPWQASIVRWLALKGIAADYCTSVDLHADATLLAPYGLFLTAGHDEYWSRTMRDRLDAFVANGGNAAILSGNTCWWQIRFEAGSGVANRTVACYKSSTADPITDASQKTVNWVDLQPPYPENKTIGLSWKLGAAWTNAQPRPDTPYVVHRPEHWAFEGTGLAAGSAFGGAYSGYEIDALEFIRDSNGHPTPTGADGTPATLRVLALADASNWDAQAKALGLPGEKSGFGAISVHSRGGASGTVFNAGATDWVLGLQPELDGQSPTPISRITLNVINKLSARYSETADVRQYHIVQASGDGWRSYYSVDGTAPAGAVLDGLAFRAFAQPAANTSPVYRYRAAQSNGDGNLYFYTLDGGLNPAYGWTLDGVAFHVYAWAAAGTQPIYQHHLVQANGQWRYFYSTLSSVGTGWVLDGVAFHVPTA